MYKPLPNRKGGSKEKPLFLGQDVANWIEYAWKDSRKSHRDVSKMLKTVDEDEKKLGGTLFPSGQIRESWFLTEDGLYEVLMQSRKPVAKQFNQRNFAPVGYKDEKGKLNFAECDYINNKTKMSNIVFIENNEVVTDSLNVAQVFGKHHKNVMVAIKNLLTELHDLGDKEGMLNFKPTQYTQTQNGQVYNKYNLTKDGLTMLVMGFTGKEALKFKTMYIKEFNKMEQELKNRDLNSYMIDDPIARAERWIKE
ncbi:Rha family transcriptional regulator [Bacillus paranthracis]